MSWGIPGAWISARPHSARAASHLCAASHSLGCFCNGWFVSLPRQKNILSYVLEKSV
ncbi:hypothetical protein PR001_g11552 [Phytophthora rubi]|uniref:Uncharacterized protein n=1 Tax=Phytophthora rubi TaxID=129364 RepID=A0A6A3LTU7_9STRA|nr:hypothetical protein PR002_g11801 [Phytophthora rubi]KAE9029192.1 hypothetical protein PR001_g11552 [Phytophthora rubi]